MTDQHDDLDYAVLVRNETVRKLIERHTLAGDRVEAERVDVIETGDTPRIVVLADETAESDAAAGALPVFRVTLNLQIECFVERARKEDVVGDLDRLLSEVKEALFGSPHWVRLLQNIASYRTARKFEKRDELIAGQAQLVVTASWRATYPPRVETPLDTVTFSPLATTPTGATQLAPPRNDGEPAVEIALPQNS